MDAEGLHRAVLVGVVCFDVAAFALLTAFPSLAASYGRHFNRDSKLWGPKLPARVAWMTQELPALLVPLALAAALPGSTPALLPPSPRGCLWASFLLHYAHRSLIYPLRIRGGKPTSAGVWAMAALFCTANGFLQGWCLLQQFPAAAAWRPHHVLGLALWLGGWLANLHADATLRALRSAPSDTGYKVPRGGLFEHVSAANYAAECAEWLGWALAAAPFAAPASFALGTLCNLAPRAASHHRFYQEKFGAEYPEGRRALVPFVW